MAKGAGIAAKVGEDIDPVNVGLRATGKAVSALPKLSALTAGIRTGLGASADSQRIHSVIELGDGSKVVIEDGRFIPVGKHGDVVGNTPRQEAVADATRSIPRIARISTRRRRTAGCPWTSPRRKGIRVQSVRCSEENLGRRPERLSPTTRRPAEQQQISENLGEKAAELHVTPHEFPNAEWVELPEDVRITDDLSEALEKGKLQYVLVKANDHAGASYAGAVLEHFKIY